MCVRIRSRHHRADCIWLDLHGGEGHALGAMDFLEKPVSPDEVRESVAGVLMEPLSLPQVSDSGDPLAGGYVGVLDRVRHAMRLANYTDAETLLMRPPIWLTRTPRISTYWAFSMRLNASIGWHASSMAKRLPPTNAMSRRRPICDVSMNCKPSAAPSNLCRWGMSRMYGTRNYQRKPPDVNVRVLRIHLCKI